MTARGLGLRILGWDRNISLESDAVMDKATTVKAWRGAMEEYAKFELELLNLLRNPESTPEEMVTAVDMYRKLHRDMVAARKAMTGFGRFGIWTKD